MTYLTGGATVFCSTTVAATAAVVVAAAAPTPNTQAAESGVRRDARHIVDDGGEGPVVALTVFYSES